MNQKVVCRETAMPSTKMVTELKTTTYESRIVPANLPESAIIGRAEWSQGHTFRWRLTSWNPNIGL
jgi:hypothetical protein